VDPLRQLAEGPVPALKPRAVLVEEEQATLEAVDLSPAGVLARAGRLHEHGEGDIEVIRVDKGAARSWLVIIPGTQRGHPPGGANPFDEAGIAEGMAYGSEEVGRAVHEALRLAGARPGEDLAAVGYSQGGIHAMNLSRDEAFLAGYSLRFVLTAGSPVGGIEPAAGVKSLHLEHELDWVPLADGVPNPDTRNRVTVTLANPVSLPPGEDFGLGPGHRLDNYEAGAHAVSVSSNPSLVESAAAFTAVTGSGGSGVVSRFSLQREPAAVTSGRPEPGRPAARPQ